MPLKRNLHNLSHYRLATCDMGELIPIGCVEVLPGDTFDHQTSLLLRVTPLVAPVMHPVEVRIHHYFVPNRLVWTGWEDFITGGPDGNDTSTVPTVNVSGNPGDLSDYLGVPDCAAIAVNELPFRAYNMIYNEFYRDQDLITEVAEDSGTVQKISWEKDYFTASRATEQKGTDVTIPISGNVPVQGIWINGAASTTTGS